jgi:hypothetical protein
MVLEASPPLQLLIMFTANNLEQTHESIALAERLYTVAPAHLVLHAIAALHLVCTAQCADRQTGD